MSYQLKLTAARLKKGTAQLFRLAYSARIFFNSSWYDLYILNYLYYAHGYMCVFRVYIVHANINTCAHVCCFLTG